MPFKLSKSLILTTLLLGGCAMSITNCKADNVREPIIRKPAVAGQFYPDNPGELRALVAGYVAAGKPLASYPSIIISPHAGYVFSGPVAGIGYATIDPTTTTVILVGPSHHKAFAGISLTEADFYETPLGRVPVAREKIDALRNNPMVHFYSEAERPEHSLEVQLPFLQTCLKKFSMVPILCNQADPAAVASLILPLIDSRTLVVISSDFSHYLQNAKARKTDSASIGAILDKKADAGIDACGEMPIKVAMALAPRMGLEPQLLDARNSFETCPEHSSADRVVGYASIVYCKSEAAAESTGLSQADKHFFLALAREALAAAVNNEKEPEPAQIPAIGRENRGCFVTLTKKGNLRGCIGYLEGIKPLFLAVIDNARSAALNDPRFSSVKPAELNNIRVEVSVLTPPVGFDYSDPTDLLEKLTPGQDGLILTKGRARSTFLPQVWEQLPDKVEFLERLALKAGLGRNDWKTATYQRYHAIHFSED
jgi:AmmeMemoRadiSam system protein B/AmmeMemoRadiSam system protein A